MQNNISTNLAGLSPAKKALLEKHLAGRKVAGGITSTIQRRSQIGFSPLSFSQQRLWFLQQLDSQNVAYNLSTALRLRGVLNVKAVEQCFNEIIRRHEVLRTTFAAQGDNPVQIIAPERNCPVSYSDLNNIPDDVRVHEALRLAKEEALRPFDLSTGPLLRVCLLDLGKQDAKRDYLLLLTLHHIVADGWSLGILIREFSALYKAFSIHQPLFLPNPPIQYADYAIWQREWLQGEVLARYLAYWTQRLDRCSSLLELPSDRPRPAICSYQGARYSFSVSKSLTARLYDLSNKEKTTLFVTLITVFNVLLYRYSRQCDINIGFPIANRAQVETENLIGFFVNTLVLRTDLSGNPPFVELLGQVRDRVLDAQAHQELPFERIVEELQPARSLSYNPLFQVMFALQNMSMESLELPDLHIEQLPLDTGTSIFDLSLLMTERDRGLEAVFEYSTDLFDECTIARMAGHFRCLLEQVSVAPETLLSELSLLTNAEQRQLLNEWNATKTAYPDRLTLHQLFEKMAEKQPDAEAVVCKTGRISYRQLNERANQLAHELRRRGVGPEIRLGLCLERSPELLVGILGILKAGGAYVPLDPNYPKERLATILADCGAAFILTRERLVEILPECGIDVICIDRDWPHIATQSANPVPILTCTDYAAYLIYTSGSTGQPKGVVISHRSAVASTWARFQYYPNPVHGFLLLSSVSFDSSVAGIFWTLSQGGRLCLPSENEALDPMALIEWIDRECPTHLLCMPSLYGLLLEQAPSNGLDLLHTVIVAGEACPLDLAARHYRHLPTVRFYNEYGPTENTVWSTVYEVGARDFESDQSIPIGHPIANTQIYLLDAHLNPVPVGAVGELYISGIGLARGYLNRPDLTAEQFMPNPFSEEFGSRFYKTGDLARYRPDGNIEFLGRIDYQVKIRGFRIELGEIEARLRQYPQVQDAVVIAMMDITSNKRLTAYLVLENGSDFEAAGVRTFLKETLPDYMIPVTFVRLDVLPLMPNGKVDRQALPAPDVWGNPSHHQYVAPRNAIEETLSSVWQQILGVERVGVHDNFFALGGDSILAIQIVGRARQAGVSFTPHQLFQNQTIAELRGVVSHTASILSEQGLVSGEVPLTPIQRWFFEQSHPNLNHWNQAIMLSVEEELDPVMVDQALRHLVSHHDALRLRFQLQEGMWHQTVMGEEFHTVFHQVDLSEINETEQAARIEAECSYWQASLCLAKGLLLRAVWFDFGLGRKAQLFIVIHHLAIDGVSWRIFLEDLQTICQQLMRGQPLALPPKTTSFKRWSERLCEWVCSESLQTEEAYWLDTVSDILPFSVDYPEGTNEEGHVAAVVVELDEAETNALLREAPLAYRTQINDLLLTALAQTLIDWRRVDTIVIDLEGHGREELFDDIDLSRTLGWFTSIYPVHISLMAGASLADTIKTVKEQLRGIPRKGIGYGVLRYLSDGAIRKQLIAKSGAQVLFNYLGQLDRQSSSDWYFVPISESVGPCHDPRDARAYELEISAQIITGKLRIEWRYSAKRFREATIIDLARRNLRRLQSLITHCLSPDAGGPTPSDFPLTRLNQKQLDVLIERLVE